MDATPEMWLRRYRAVVREAIRKPHGAGNNRWVKQKEWTIPFDDFVILSSAPCVWCGWPAEWHIGSGLDRLGDAASPYAIGNVVPSCFPCNVTRAGGPNKKGGFSPEEMLLYIGPAIYQVHLERWKEAA